MDATQVIVLLCIGVFGGVWNAIAGGATLFTFPALMAVGLPPVVANATNYLALLPANAAALPAYRDELRGLGRRLFPMVLISGIGAIAGSLLLLASPSDTFVTLVPFLILLAAGLFAFGEYVRAWLVAKLGSESGKEAIYVLLFASSIYGGYFGAGLGIILLAVAQLLGFSDFNVANSIKNFLATSFTIVSIAVFGLGGIIAWPQAFVMMVGSTLGGYAGGRLAKRVNSEYLRVFVIVFALVLALVYFFRAFD
ncbi:MAG: sulfite exporter TauE/SafE family protein [Pseudomonadota bacterium]